MLSMTLNHIDTLSIYSIDNGCIINGKVDHYET